MNWTMWLVGFGVVLLLVLIHDLSQTKKSIIHNFPIVGRLRYILIEIGPELRQYIVANNREEAPFNRSEREWIDHSADRKNNYFGFGTDDQIYGIGYPIIKHSVFPFGDESFTGSARDKNAELPCAKVLGARHGRARPYRPASVLNISAMSYGSLGKNAITALNKGARLANCFHTTGEGGCSPHHQHGADVCLQIGTGYFGCRTLDGEFDLDRLAGMCLKVPAIRMIEVKLSQGAKPGKGGVLPAAKVTEEIAEIRGLRMGEDCISPNVHNAFHDVPSMIDFIERIAERTGLPVGIKSAVGHLRFFRELAERMKSERRGPDFLSIDGGEGGTGAAPLTFADHVSLPYKLAFTRVYRIFKEAGIADDVVWIGSGRLGFPDRAAVAMALGADLINVGREAMMAIGCIQAQKCHTGHCPTGVATHNAWLQRGLDVDHQSKRFQGYVESFRNEFAAVTHAAGFEHPGQFTPHDIEISSGPGQFSSLHELYGYDKTALRPHPEAAPV